MVRPVNLDEAVAEQLVKDLKQRQNNRNSATPTTRTPIVMPSLSYTVRNDSTSTVPAYGCMKMTGAELDPNTNRYVISISKPDGIGGSYLFNNEFEIAPNTLGQGFTDIVKAYYQPGLSVAFGQYLGPETDWFLESASFPALMVIGDLGNAICFGQVNRGWPVRHRVKPQNNVEVGQSGLCTFYQGNPLVATSQQASVLLDWEAGDEQVSANKEATAEFLWHDQVWRFSSAECEDDEEPPSKVTVSDDTSTPGSSSTAAAHINQDGVFINQGGTFTNVTAPPP